MNPISLLLIGAGGHALSAIDVIEQEGRFSIAGLVGLASEIGSQIAGYPVLGGDVDLPDLLRRTSHALISVGQIKTAEPRIRLFSLLQQYGCQAPVIISPKAYVSPRASLGAGTIVMHGAIVNAGAVVGANCIINSQALVEHDTVIGDHCHIATAAAINGGVRVDRGSFVGSLSVVRQGIHIGEGCLIGMGQRIVSDCEAGSQIPETRPSK